MAFTLADDVLRQGVQGICELITETGLINVDFSHIKSVMQRGGGALMAIGTGSGPNKVQQAIEKALHHPLLDDIDLYSATGMIANFTGSSNMSFKDVTDALHTLQQATGSHADIIPGIITDPRMEDRVQLILIVTGIGKKMEEKITATFEKDTTVSEPNEVYRNSKFQDNDAPVQENFNEIGLSSYGNQPNLSDNLSVPAFLRRRQNNK
jgi:cell division protein FtsZ